MINKTCIKCGEEKPLTEYYINKMAKGGFFAMCKGCVYLQRLARWRTRDGCIRKIYDSQIMCAKNRGMHRPTYSAEWLVSFCLNSDDFEDIYLEWAKGGYETDMRPSVDRIDDYKSYTEDNIQITTWKENRLRINRDMVNGINNKNSDAVVSYCKDGMLYSEYYSTRNAGRDIGISATNISSCFHGRQKTAAGLIWRKKKDLISRYGCVPRTIPV